MIIKMEYGVNGNLPNAVLKWDPDLDDYIVSLPKGITSVELIVLVDEIKRITKFEY